MSLTKNFKLMAGLGLGAGVLLIILSFISPGLSGGSKMPEYNLSRIDSDAFIKAQEKKIMEILSRIDGVSDPYVMLTLDTSSEHVYALKRSIKESSSRSGESSQREVSEDIIFYGDDRQPILIKEIEPKIKGVAVICRGISGPEIQLKIINLVSTVLNLPTNRVYVISAD